MFTRILLLLSCVSVLSVPLHGSDSRSLSGLPIYFEENRGQAPPETRFVGRSAGFVLSLSPGSASLRWPGSEKAIQTRLLGSNAQAPLTPEGLLPLHANYLLGNAPANWHLDVHAYSRIRSHGVYPGIDLLYYGNERTLEYDFIANPGSDPAKISMEINGANRVSIEPTGDLVIASGAGSVHWKKPEIYQEIDGVRRKVAGGFVLRGNRKVGFRIAAYDHARPLIIDPELSYSTYLGGTANDAAKAIGTDSAGNVYIAGQTSSIDLPATRSAFQTSYGGESSRIVSGDGFIAKFSASGALLYLTYLGGSADDLISAIAVDAAGNAYVTGYTNSQNFPVTAGVYQKSFAGFGGNAFPIGDAFAAKLNPSGNQLLYSTYLGGAQDDIGTAIAIDAAGNAYITGATLSRDFPVTSKAYQSAPKGAGGQPILPCCNVPYFVAGDVFLTKLNPSGTGLVYSTYWGGSQDDAALAVAVDATGSAYVAGYTLSPDIPLTAGALQNAYGGQDSQNEFFHRGDAFIAKFTPDGSGLAYSTYFGGNGDDTITALALDGSGSLYMTGATTSRNLPVTPGAIQSTYSGYYLLPFLIEHSLGDAFVAKLNPAGTSLAYCTYLGGNANDQGLGIAVDGAGNAYVAGSTDSRNFPVSSDAVQKTFGGDGGQRNLMLFGDGFLAQINPTGTTLLYSTFLGGSQDDLLQGVALDQGGNVHVVGNTVSTNYPVKGSPVQAQFAGLRQVKTFFKGDVVLGRFSGFSNTPAVAAVTNAASNAAGVVSPGMIFVLYGTGLGGKTLTGASIDPATGKLASIQAGTRILFDGIPAPIVYASANQVSGIVPYGVAAATSTQVVAEYNGQRSVAFPVKVVDAAPGIFSADFSGTGQVVAFNEDGTINSPANPANKGSIIVFFGTGEGQTKPAGADGVIANGPVYPAPVLQVNVTVGGAQAQVLYAGAAPQLVAGLLQINARLSPDTPSGNQPLLVNVSTFRSQPSLTVSVR